MLRFLLDEHISREVALQAKAKRPSMDIQSIHDWESGTFLGVPDPEILLEAAKQRLTLVTYDQRTLWKHAADLLEVGRNLGGVIFVDDQTIPPNDIGGLMRALVWLWESKGNEDWQNRLVFLTPGPAMPAHSQTSEYPGYRQGNTDEFNSLDLNPFHRPPPGAESALWPLVARWLTRRTAPHASTFIFNSISER